MKPYTLEWWLIQYAESFLAAETSIESGAFDNYDRYLILTIWINRRIIKKYGESE